MSIELFEFTSVHTTSKLVDFEGEQVLQVIKSEKIMEFDENTYCKVVDSSFHNGIIEVKVLSRLLPDAPDFARGFIGIAFRISEDDSSFESFYIRPTNGRVNDPIRKNRGTQYFSYPDYTFEYFRDRGITAFESSADIGLDEWITLKAVIEDQTATFYVNGGDIPTLVVDNLILGAKTSGSIGLFVDIGTQGFFKDLKITSYD
ncbi:hypothetical protein UAY_01089 [Enterococcus moraviensis ATCC BAA-383]|uniref:3-keto-disaccharide hydrolase domain-containing protein n=1 Tax=Enterococcus moraviensis ATCC BAA-383 TaxID=1158609 RepID=R2R241_9ENTE|nr:hypothetical protein [Enterococcus moraviensis]EOI01681.1 hypothetical protein UAY_01089 [Enterococcus moraviensis ATCC BAA-383]EOT73784.1 hypothetical protein I586_00778 [Enterococcus moraviensis ATCC BAA-383]OJG69345.1 hypothetical protein RV09_GL000744 [Enterococcus moraviensis]